MMPVLLHWEFIESRPRQYRVADENDDVVCDFLTWREASDYVGNNNEKAWTARKNANWHYC